MLMNTYFFRYKKNKWVGGKNIILFKEMKLKEELIHQG